MLPTTWTHSTCFPTSKRPDKPRRFAQVTGVEHLHHEDLDDQYSVGHWVMVCIYETNQNQQWCRGLAQPPEHQPQNRIWEQGIIYIGTTSPWLIRPPSTQCSVYLRGQAEKDSKETDQNDAKGYFWQLGKICKCRDVCQSPS